MSNVLHRTTLEYRSSVNDPDFPDPPWLEVPPASANATFIASGVPSIYWKLTGDVLSEMTAPEKAVVDAAILVAQNLSAANEGITTIDEPEELGATTRELIELLTKTHNKLANRLNELYAAMEAMRVSTGGTANLRLAMPLPSAEVISEGPAPATFTNLQNRSKANEIADFKADLLAGLQDV